MTNYRKRTPAEHRKILQDQKANKIQPTEMNMKEKLIHVHKKLKVAMIKHGIEIPYIVKQRGYAPLSNIKEWEKATGVKNEGDTPLSVN